MNLSDVTLLLTRPTADSEQFLETLDAALGPVGRVCISPLFEISFEGSLDAYESGNSIIFTSKNGVSAFLAAGGSPQGRAFAVGEKTAKAATKAGFEAEVVGPTADHIFQHLVQFPPSAPLLHVTGRHHRGALVERLNQAGLNAERVVLYDQMERALSSEARTLLNGNDPILAPLFSPRMARLFREQTQTATAPLWIAALSAAVAERWEDPVPDRLMIAKSPDQGALIDAVAALLEAPRASG